MKMFKGLRSKLKNVLGKFSKDVEEEATEVVEAPEEPIEAPEKEPKTTPEITTPATEQEPIADEKSEEPAAETPIAEEPIKEPETPAEKEPTIKPMDEQKESDEEQAEEKETAIEIPKEDVVDALQEAETDEKIIEELVEEQQKEPAPSKQTQPIEGVKITYFVHGTTTDNEQGLATGWNDGELSTVGKEQAEKLPEQCQDNSFSIVFCSDLKRAVDSATLGYGQTHKIIQDERLREANYGDMNGKEHTFKDHMTDYVTNRFPNGESYKDVERRMAAFCNFLYKEHYGEHVAIIAHQAPQLALDVLLNNQTWDEAIASDWRKAKNWQPGWTYTITHELDIPTETTAETITEETAAETKEEPAEETEKKKGFFGRMFSKKKEEPAEEVPATIEEVKEEPAAKAPVEETKTATQETGEETIPAEEAEKPKKKDGFFSKLTKITLSEEKFEELFWDLEVTLLENNVAVEVIEKIKIDLKEALTGEKVSKKSVDELIMETLRKTIKEILSVKQIDLLKKANEKQPLIITMIGVNGSGKTTTLAKLIKYFQDNGKSIVVAAADTFRAAAIQQLEEHTTRLGVKLIKHDYNADPAAVAFDAVKHAKAKGIDIVLIDSAGRLHSNDNLMNELKKLIRVNQPDINLFVGEAITGNDCVEQAKLFDEAVGIDGIILAKADVDEKGGAAISASFVTKKPVLFLGTGQNYEDLEPFDPEKVLENLGL